MSRSGAGHQQRIVAGVRRVQIQIRQTLAEAHQRLHGQRIGRDRRRGRRQTLQLRWTVLRHFLAKQAATAARNCGTLIAGQRVRFLEVHRDRFRFG